MLKIFLASTAVVTTFGFAVLAQEAGDPLVKQPGSETHAPADIAPSAPAPAPAAQAESGEPMSPAPSTETAQEPAAEPTAPGAMAPAAGVEPVLTPVVAADVSVDELTGANIQTRDGQVVAQIDDVLMAPDGKIENVVAQFGGFLGFGGTKVLLAPDEIEVFQDQSGTYVVQTDLTPDALEGRPEYKVEQ